MPDTIPLSVVAYIQGRLRADKSTRMDVTAGSDEATTKIYVLKPEYLPFGPGLVDLYIGKSGEFISFCKMASDLLCDCECCGRNFCDEEDLQFLEQMTRERESLNEALIDLRRNIELLERLVEPDLMDDVYRLLVDELGSDERIVDFISIAERSFFDSRDFRRIKKRSTELSKQISEGARRLALLLRELQSMGVRLPSSIKKDNSDGEFFLEGRNRAEFVLQMRRLSEEKPDRSEMDVQSGSFDLVQTLFEVSSSLKDWSGDLGYPVAEAAISTRQHSVKTSYIRAFAASLREVDIEITPGIRRAIALTANVVLDDANASVSEDDVRKALERLGSAGGL